MLRSAQESRWRDWWTNFTLDKTAADLDFKGSAAEQELRMAKRLHVFVAVHDVNWEYQALVESWRKVARVTHYDWGEEFDQYDDSWFAHGRAEFQDRLLTEVESAHRREPVNVFFSYLSGRWVDPTTIQAIREMGIQAINFSFDDTRQFWGARVHGRWTGVAPIAAAYDLNVTVARPLDTKKYSAIGARAIFLPPAGNPDTFPVLRNDPKNRTRITFIGQRYGLRGHYIEALRHAGLPIESFGIGWPSGPISHSDKVRIYQESLITLGFGFLGEGSSVSMKGRDFEVPMTGTCYVTTFEPTLTKLFVPDHEMVFYSSLHELTQKIEYLSRNRELALEIGEAGRKKALEEHQWHMRWLRLLKEISVASTSQ